MNKIVINNFATKEDVEKESKSNIIFGCIWFAASLVLVIALPILIKVDDLAFCLVLGAIITSFGPLLIILGIYRKKYPKKCIRNDADEGKTTPRDTVLYRNYELTYEPAKALYCKASGKTEDELTESDEEVIWEYAYDDFAYILAWIMEKDFFKPNDDEDDYMAKEMLEYASKIKAHEMKPTDYLAAFDDGVFDEQNLKPKAAGFVKEYLENSDYIKGNDVPKPGNIIGAYYAELEEFAAERLNTVLFGFPFRWEDYEAFKPNIDAAYKKYLSNQKK